MFTKESLQTLLQANPDVQQRLETLQEAERINPDFRKPHILGGYLRNIALGVAPRDCDVFFQGVSLNQPGITESVYEAETKLGVSHYPNWEFENAKATGLSGDFYEDIVGEHSFETDYITMLLLNSKGELFMGPEEDKVLSDLNNRVYDIRIPGVEVWAKHRGGGRSFESCILGDLVRALYLSHVLNLTISDNTANWLYKFDEMFEGLDTQGKEARIKFWLNKTNGHPDYQVLLDQFGIKSLHVIG